MSWASALPTSSPHGQGEFQPHLDRRSSYQQGASGNLSQELGCRPCSILTDPSESRQTTLCLLEHRTAPRANPLPQLWRFPLWAISQGWWDQSRGCPPHPHLLPASCPGPTFPGQGVPPPTDNTFLFTAGGAGEALTWGAMEGLVT